MEKPVRILHIMSSFGGGISSFIRNKANSVDHSNIIIDVATFNPATQEFEEEIKNNGGKIFAIPNPKKYGFRNFSQVYKRILEENGPYYMVHSNLGGYRSFLFYLLSKSKGVEKFVVHAHSSDLTPDKKKSFSEKTVRKIEQTLNRIGSDLLASCGINASAYHFGKRPLKNKNIMHIPNSIDLNRYMNELSESERNKIKADNNLPLNKPIIGHVGRFDQNKNQKFQLEIIQKMRETGIDFHWIFIGDGVTREEIEDEIVKRGLSDYATILGRREDANILYQIMDAAVLTSISEGLPTVCVEAQAAGVPCVVSKTITREIDMGLDLVSFASLESVEEWIKAILDALNKKIPSQQAIKQKIEEKKFTNSSSAQLYESFVFGKIKHYEL